MLEKPRACRRLSRFNKGGHALLGAHAAKQQHDTVLAHDFAAHHLVHVGLQGLDLARDLLELRIRHDADLRILQRDGVAGVLAVDDADQTRSPAI